MVWADGVSNGSSSHDRRGVPRVLIVGRRKGPGDIVHYQSRIERHGRNRQCDLGPHSDSDPCARPWACQAHAGMNPASHKRPFVASPQTSCRAPDRWDRIPANCRQGCHSRGTTAPSEPCGAPYSARGPPGGGPVGAHFCRCWNRKSCEASALMGTARGTHSLS